MVRPVGRGHTRPPLGFLYVHEGAGLAAGALGNARLVESHSLTHGAPSLVLDESVGCLEGRSGDRRETGDKGAGGADEGEEGSGLVG